jgi:isocitrate dehydrogenase
MFAQMMIPHHSQAVALADLAESNTTTPAILDLAARIKAAAAGVDGLHLTLITNRGVKVWPEGFAETFKTDHWRCRFRATAGSQAAVPFDRILQAMAALSRAGLDVIKSENLCFFKNTDGSISPGFSLGQGE